MNTNSRLQQYPQSQQSHQSMAGRLPNGRSAGIPSWVSPGGAGFSIASRQSPSFTQPLQGSQSVLRQDEALRGADGSRAGISLDEFPALGGSNSQDSGTPGGVSSSYANLVLGRGESMGRAPDNHSFDDFPALPGLLSPDVKHSFLPNHAQPGSRLSDGLGRVDDRNSQRLSSDNLTLQQHRSSLLGAMTAGRPPSSGSNHPSSMSGSRELGMAREGGMSIRQQQAQQAQIAQQNALNPREQDLGMQGMAQQRPHSTMGTGRAPPNLSLMSGPPALSNPNMDYGGAPGLTNPRSNTPMSFNQQAQQTSQLVDRAAMMGAGNGGRLTTGEVERMKDGARDTATSAPGFPMSAAGNTMMGVSDSITGSGSKDRELNLRSMAPGQMMPNGHTNGGLRDNEGQPESTQLNEEEKYTIAGLLPVIRMSNPDASMLALGNDLTSLGLKLTSEDRSLSSTFVSPWMDTTSSISVGGVGEGRPLVIPDFNLPQCYNLTHHAPPPPPATKIPQFQDETLFYIFYTCPRSRLQELAAQELTNRNWRFHKSIGLWLTKEPGSEPSARNERMERGTYIFFDSVRWERVKKAFDLYYEDLEERQPTP